MQAEADMVVTPARTWVRSRRTWAVTVAAGLALAAAWYAAPGSRLDSARPWRVELGRGSGMVGLNTVAVGSDGTATAYRLRVEDRGRPFWETTTLRLPPEAVDEVRVAVDQHRLLGLGRVYRAAGVHDGTQWVLRVVQGDFEKAVYFDNRFPRAIEGFADDLDRVLAANGLAEAQWTRVPDAEARNHEQELWRSTER